MSNDLIARLSAEVVQIPTAIAYANLAGICLLLALFSLPGRAEYGIPAMPHADMPSSEEQGVISADESSLGEADLPPLLEPGENPELPAFLHDASFAGQARNYYLNRRNFDGSHNEAWVLGGSLAFRSGYLADFFRIGTVGYTSQRLYGPENRDGTMLLEPGQHGYSVLGQLYGEFKLGSHLSAAFGKKEYNTPYINANDTRETPNTFQGYSLYGAAGGEDGSAEWRYGAGYINKIKLRNSDQFTWMSQAAGASAERGVYAGGVSMRQGNFSLGAFNYYSDDIINIFYGETKYSLSLGAGTELRLSAQYSNQRSTGEDLLIGKSFATGQGGVKADMEVGHALFSLAYTETADGYKMQNPWSGYPGYTSVQVRNFNQAGESAVMLRGQYDFSDQGCEGLSAYALFVQGTSVIGGPDENETDFNLQWQQKSGVLKGFSFRSRYAMVDQRGSGGETQDEFRLIVNYDF